MVDQGLAAIDIGSSYGDYADVLSKLVGHVHCFEPIPEVRNHAEKRLGERTNITFYPCALSDHEGSEILRIPLFMRQGRLEEISYIATIEPANQPQCDGQRYENVAVRMLDSFGFRDIGFVKIDVEGHEEAVLKGSRTLLQGWGPNLLIEIEERHKAGAIETIRQFLATLDYQGVFYSWYDQKFIPVEQFQADMHQRSSDLMTSRYSNNVVFSRSEETLARLVRVTPAELG